MKTLVFFSLSFVFTNYVFAQANSKKATISDVRRLAESGNSDYIYELASRYEQGDADIAQDFKEAVRWHCKNRLKMDGMQNRSMLKLEKIAESDPEVKDSSMSAEIIVTKARLQSRVLIPILQLRFLGVKKAIMKKLKIAVGISRGWINMVSN